MSAPEGYIQVAHGRLTLNIPRDIFSGTDCHIVPKKQKEFGELTKSRYPWITDNALEIIFKNAREVMLETLDEETGGRNGSANLEAKGNLEGAINHMKAHLKEDPDDADGWYALGKLLCAAGRTEEGYRAFNKGRSLF